MTVVDAYIRGIKQGYRIASNPDPRRLSNIADTARRTGFSAIAWKKTGTYLTDAMKTQKQN